jgi:hypothetical protein
MTQRKASIVGAYRTSMSQQIDGAFPKAGKIDWTATPGKKVAPASVETANSSLRTYIAAEPPMAVEVSSGTNGWLEVVATE